VKHLLVCADGTWNTPDQEDNGLPAPTNVVKFRHCVAENKTSSSRSGGRKKLAQRAYYHPGVGTDGGLIKRTAGGAWGHGLGENIQSAYHWLARSYAPGDAIFLVGFSRGAYTVRSLGGLLNQCGLPDLTGVKSDEGWRRIKTAFKSGYRERKDRADWAEDWKFHHESKTPIRFMGVWDTVGALGIPDDLALLNLLDRPANWRFHDTTLGSNVEVARHAVALDEIRSSFTPTLWTSHSDCTDMKQVWFPGVHSDVGGGYAETGLSDGALQWMIQEAKKAGLAFNAALTRQIKPDPLAVLHDSLKGLFEIHRSRPRNTPSIASSAGDLHDSAKKRHKSPPISQGPYRTTTHLAVGQSSDVDVFAREHWSYTGLYLEPGKYRLRATGEWVDGSITCGPKGTADGQFDIREIAHLVGTGIGWIERGWRSATGQDSADFKLTRRHEEWPWFSLIGAVANSDRRPQGDGSPPPHQTFRIGSRKTLSLSEGGYLFAYANDAWDFYENNRGSVQLNVERLPG